MKLPWRRKNRPVPEPEGPVLVIDGEPAEPYEINNVVGWRSASWARWIDREPERARSAATQFTRAAQASAEALKAARKARTPRVLIIPPPVAYPTLAEMAQADVVFKINDDWSATCLKDSFGDRRDPSVCLLVSGEPLERPS